MKTQQKSVKSAVSDEISVARELAEQHHQYHCQRSWFVSLPEFYLWFNALAPITESSDRSKCYCNGTGFYTDGNWMSKYSSET